MATVEEFRRAQRAEGPATILAIGTANPSNCLDQSTYADYYFRVTNNEHKIELKNKFNRIWSNGENREKLEIGKYEKWGEKTTIKKRYMHLTEELLKENPSLGTYDASSFDARQEMLVVEIPKLGKEAALEAIKEWGQPKSKITHLVFCTSGGVDMPGADYQLAKIMGLNLSVKRVIIYQQGCFAGGTALRLAKDLAENNKGARVLVVCSEIMVNLFRGPCENLSSLVAQALFGDGAAAMIVGSDPIPRVEKPLYEMFSAGQTIVMGSDGAINGPIRENGTLVQIGKDVPSHFANNIEGILVEAFKPLGITDWNSIFWIAHPGGPAILDQVEAKLGLNLEKMHASRHVLAEYGNMQSACVLFILDEVRKKSAKDGLNTTGEGLEWGVLFGFGPGLTVETIVLHSLATI
ncbi:hypothetical protein LWI29_020729 [Acer saccharum]|uniref:Chalcone synthase n=1 Tax=Acer saccharum TaxID=4024 RepID=A0AA39TI23_ACESA|nr:hypothetical protein LWI29_020729 [Acer saccharum]